MTTIPLFCVVSMGPMGWVTLVSVGVTLFFLNTNKKKRNRKVRRRWKRKIGSFHEEYTIRDTMKDTGATLKEALKAWRDAKKDAKK